MTQIRKPATLSAQQRVAKAAASLEARVTRMVAQVQKNADALARFDADFAALRDRLRR